MLTSGEGGDDLSGRGAAADATCVAHAQLVGIPNSENRNVLGKTAGRESREFWELARPCGKSKQRVRMRTKS
jgi:hypothetical protein